MFDKFTDRARKVINIARKEAERLHHDHIGTEHVLLGLLIEGYGVAANVLENMDMNVEELRREVEKLVKPTPDPLKFSQITFTNRAKKALEFAIEEARDLEHQYIGTEHLLLGLLHEPQGRAAQILETLGVKLEDVRNDVISFLSVDVQQHNNYVIMFGELNLSSSAKKALQFAREEVQILKQEHLGAEHLLLGLLRDNDGIAAQVMLSLGLKVEDVRNELLKRMNWGL